MSGQRVKYVRGTVRSGVGDRAACRRRRCSTAARTSTEERRSRPVRPRHRRAGDGWAGQRRVRWSGTCASPNSDRRTGEPMRAAAAGARRGVAFDGAKADMRAADDLVRCRRQRYEHGVGRPAGDRDWRRALAVPQAPRGCAPGGRFNTVGAEERGRDGRSERRVCDRGFYLDGHLVRGGVADERGWGMASPGVVLRASGGLRRGVRGRWPERR